MKGSGAPTQGRISHGNDGMAHGHTCSKASRGAWEMRKLPRGRENIERARRAGDVRNIKANWWVHGKVAMCR